jgi:hypothetical protein
MKTLVIRNELQKTNWKSYYQIKYLMMKVLNLIHVNNQKKPFSYRVCNSDNDPISADSWPDKFMFVNVLKLRPVRLIQIGQNEQPSKLIKKVRTGQRTYIMPHPE